MDEELNGKPSDLGDGYSIFCSSILRDRKNTIACSPFANHFLVRSMNSKSMQRYQIITIFANFTALSRLLCSDFFRKENAPVQKSLKYAFKHNILPFPIPTQLLLHTLGYSILHTLSKLVFGVPPFIPLTQLSS
jgi:hypothetical protein